MAAALLQVCVAFGADTNQPAPDQSASRTNALGQGRRERDRQSTAARDQISSATDFSAFRIITERNIFDPNRAPRRSEPVVRSKPRSVDSFALVGIMSYEKGTFAFFDGTQSEFKKALKQSDAIAGFRVASIDADSVKLVSDEKQYELRIGTQMRREDQGEWEKSSRSEPYSPSRAASTGPSQTFSRQSSSSSTAPAAPSAADNAILERLRQRREQE